MRGVSWENMNMKPLKLKDITPDKILELEKHAENVRLHDLTFAQLQELSQRRKIAEATLSETEMECKLRAMRAHSIGFSKAELSKIFDVPSRTITKWIG